MFHLSFFIFFILIQLSKFEVIPLIPVREASLYGFKFDFWVVFMKKNLWFLLYPCHLLVLSHFPINVSFSKKCVISIKPFPINLFAGVFRYILLCFPLIYPSSCIFFFPRLPFSLIFVLTRETTMKIWRFCPFEVIAAIVDAIRFNF